MAWPSAGRRPVLALTILVCLFASGWYTAQHAPRMQQLDAPCPAFVGNSAIVGNDTSNNTKIAAACDPVGRSSFILKVYAATAFQLAISAVVAWFVASWVAANNGPGLPMPMGSAKSQDLEQILSAMAYSEPFLCIWTVLSFYLLTELIVCRMDPSRGLHLFEAFAVVEGVWLGLACAFVPRIIILAAAMLTISVFAILAIISLGISALGVELGFMEPILTEGLVIIFGYGIARLALGSTKDIMWGVAGTALWCGYILFDSNQIALRYRESEYIAGALDLYLDVINLFLELLELLQEGK